LSNSIHFSFLCVFLLDKEKKKLGSSRVQQQKKIKLLVALLQEIEFFFFLLLMVVKYGIVPTSYRYVCVIIRRQGKK